MARKSETGVLGALGTAVLVVLASCSGGTTVAPVSTTSTTVRRSVKPATDFCTLLVHSASTFTLDVELTTQNLAARYALARQRMQRILVTLPQLEAAAPAALEPEVVTAFNPWQQYARAVLSGGNHFPPRVLYAVFGGDAKVRAATRHLVTLCGINVARPAR